jgi:BCCT family betaine/carnitine transporter
VGIFVTRISRGRTLREVIFGMLVYGSLGGGLFYMVLGNLSMGLHLAGDVDILAVMAEHDGNRAIVAAFDQLPLPELTIGLFCIVCVIFSATTYDSAALTLAASASRSLAPNEDPPRWHRTLWAFALAILPLSLMYIGGLRVAQTAVLVASLPILITSVFAGIALLKALRAYPGDAAGIDDGTVNT